MRFSFEVAGKPVPQGSMRSYGRGITHNNRKALMPWRAAVAAHAHAKRPTRWDNTGPMGLEVTFWLPRPKSHYRANGGLRDMDVWWPTTKPDLDKLARALCDGLTDAGIWVDDSQVVELGATKRYDPGAGRLTCTVARLTEKGSPSVY